MGIGTHRDSETGVMIPSEYLDQVQVSADGSTVWVHALDGSTVGRFSKRFGLDVHATVTEQLAGASQCLHCTHTPPSPGDWSLFCSLMLQHHGVKVDQGLMRFPLPC